MDRNSPKYMLNLAIALTIGCILQIYGTLRYIRRLPEDTFGVVLYITTCVLFGVLAVFYYSRWVETKHNNNFES